MAICSSFATQFLETAPVYRRTERLVNRWRSFSSPTPPTAPAIVCRTHCNTVYVEGRGRTLPAVQIPPVGGLSCCGRRPLHVGNSRGKESHQQYRGCAGVDAAARFIAYAQSRRVGDGPSPRAERYGTGGGMGFTRRPRVSADALGRRWLAGFSEDRAAGEGGAIPP
jgi:hypothetical protein